MMRKGITAVGLIMSAFVAQADLEGPLTKWEKNHSIMNRGAVGNSYNNQLDEFVIRNNRESSFGDFLYEASNNNAGGNCQACFTPNPPPFCFEPGHHCYQESMPIDSGVVFLIIAGGLFGAYMMKKRQMQLQEEVA